MVVPRPGIDSTKSSPPIASSRSAIPWQPRALPGGRGVESPPVVLDAGSSRSRSIARARSWRVTLPRTWRCSGGPRGTRSTPRPRSPVGIGRCRRSARRSGWRPCEPAPRVPRPTPCRRARGDRCLVRGRGGPRSPQPHRPGAVRAARQTCAASRSTSCSANRSLTWIATSCCWAPSWMFRSILRRSRSCAATSRRRESRSSSMSRTFRSTRPAWAARSLTKRSFAVFIGSFAGMVTESAPRSDPWWRTSTARSRRELGETVAGQRNSVRGLRVTRGR